MAEVHVGKGGGGKRRRAVVIPPMKAGLRIALALIGAVITAAVAFFVMLPALNFRAPEFYGYLLIVVGSFVVLLYLFSNAGKQAEFMPWVRRTVSPAIAIALVIALFFGAAWVFSSPFFLAQRYHNIMEVRELTFAEEIDEVDFALLPKIDEAAARVIAQATLGELIDDVLSQFELSRNSTQIVYNGRPVRIFPLAYINVIRWIENTRDGLPGFVMVYMDTQESEFHFLEQSVRFTDEEHFFRHLERHLRFRFPTYLLGTASFEIDDERNPYWVVPRMDRTVGLIGGEDVIGVLLVNAVTGEINEYALEDVPEWVDRVYNAQLLRMQFNWFGLYGEGFWNSILAQRGVRQATPDYNYLIQRNDVYMYSGVSAAGGGEDSIIGFLLVNQRTRDAHFYQIPGAAETFARNAAQGAVQAHGWRATHPLLINVSGHATYFMALKDNNNIVQGFAMTNVQQFNLINVWAESLDVAIERYIAALSAHNLDVAPETGDALAPNMTSGAIASIHQVAIDGTTNLLIRLQGDSAYYRMAVTNSNVYLALLTVGDVITITSAMDAQLVGNVIPASSIALGAVVLEPPVEDYAYNGNDDAISNDDAQPEE